MGEGLERVQLSNGQWLSDIYSGVPGKFSIDREAWRQRKIDRWGTDSIVPDVALSNLVEVSRVFRSVGLTSWPINGTLLGLVRDGGLIPHDSDVDLGALWSERARLHTALTQLLDLGFEIIRVSQRGDGVSIMKNDEYIDISLYKIEWGLFRRYLTSAWGAIDPFRLSFPLVEADVQGQIFSVPQKSERLLAFWFGNSWKVPERGRSRNCNVPSIIWKRTLSARLKRFTDWLYLRFN